MKHFVTLHFVMNGPGNAVEVGHQLAKMVARVAPAPAEYARIGAATLITDHNNTTLLVTESPEEVLTMVDAVLTELEERR